MADPQAAFLASTLEKISLNHHFQYSQINVRMERGPRKLDRMKQRDPKGGRANRVQPTGVQHLRTNNLRAAAA